MSKKNKKNPYHNPQKTSARRTIQHIISFVLAIVIFFMGASTIMLMGFLSNRSVKQAFLKQEYYYGIQDTILTHCKYYSVPNSLSSDIFEDVFTTQVIADDVRAYVDATIKGKQYEFKLDNLNKSLKSAVVKDLTSRGIEITSDLDDQIDEFCTRTLNEYKLAVTIPYSEYFFMVKSSTNALLAILDIFLVLVIAGTVFILLAIYRFKVVHKTLRMLAYSFISGGFMILASSLYFRLSGFVQNINIRPLYLYDALQNYVQYGVSFAYFFSVVLIIISVILAISSEVLRERVKRNYFLRLEDNFRERINREIESSSVDVDSKMKDVNNYRSRKEHDEFNEFAKEQLSNVTLDTEIDYDTGVKPRNRRINRTSDTSGDTDFAEVNPDDYY